MKILVVCAVIFLSGTLGVQGREKKSDEAIRAGYIEACKLMGVSQSEMDDVLKDFPKTFTISGTRDLMKRHNFRKEYVEVFEKFVAGLVEHKNSPEWKEKFAGLLESIKVPGPDNIKRFKQIAPDALPADKKIRKQLLLDSGFDKDVVERLDPYLEQLEEMEF